MDSLAYAMGTGGTGGTGGQGGVLSTFILFGSIFAIFYFLLIRPQQKQRKKHEEMLAALKKGDRIITSGGLHGEISGIKDDVVTMEIAPQVRVKISRSAIAGALKKDGN
jgi:preprotein translocase subunit YajC